MPTVIALIAMTNFNIELVLQYFNISKVEAKACQSMDTIHTITTAKSVFVSEKASCPANRKLNESSYALNIAEQLVHGGMNLRVRPYL